MTFDQQRHNMVVEQLQQRGISDPRVLAAMESVPRHAFVPAEIVDAAYEDRALPLGMEQTISQPYTVAFMCQEAHIRPDDKVLEIGTGSGYGAAVLSVLAREVFTVERIHSLAVDARCRIEQFGGDNIHVRHDDGTLGLQEEAPFDVILVAAGAERIPQAYREQLSAGGRLLIPVGPPTAQRMLRITRHGEGFTTEDLGGFGFVPLVSDQPD